MLSNLWSASSPRQVRHRSQALSRVDAPRSRTQRREGAGPAAPTSYLEENPMQPRS